MEVKRIIQMSFKHVILEFLGLYHVLVLFAHQQGADRKAVYRAGLQSL